MCVQGTKKNEKYVIIILKMITFLRNRCLCGTCYTNDPILSFDWDTILSCGIDLSVDLWTHHFLDIMKKCIPHKVVNTRCHLPWLASYPVSLRSVCRFLSQPLRKESVVHFACASSIIDFDVNRGWSLK